MPDRAAVEIVLTNVQDHPAVKAWCRLKPQQTYPRSIVILQEQWKSGVYRLEGVGLGGTAVIAKRCLKATGRIERIIYEQVLPCVPVVSLHYYGCSDEDDDCCWLFLEDVGTERFSPLIPEQRALAARWLGIVHTSAAHITAASTLPEGGPDRYLGHLRSARDAILRHRTNPVLRAGDVVVLENILEQFDFLEERWNHLERWCEGMPRTLVHGDFRPKNIRVRTDQTGTGFYPLDWETAGWGVPAADLAPTRKEPAGCQIDLMVYRSVVRESWPSLDLVAIEQLVNIGRIFRQVAAIAWATTCLGFETFEQLWWAVESMRIYHDDLSDAMQGL